MECMTTHKFLNDLCKNDSESGEVELEPMNGEWDEELFHWFKSDFYKSMW